MQELPTRSEWEAWRRTRPGQLLMEYLVAHLNAYTLKHVEAENLGQIDDPIKYAFAQVKDQAQAAMYKHILELSYNEVCEALNYKPIGDDEDDEESDSSWSPNPGP